MSEKVKMRRVTNLNTKRISHEIEIENRWYKIVSVKTPAEYTGENRPNLLEHLEKNNIIAIAQVKRPKGKKIYTAYKYRNGQIKFA